jgi:hypothetical protein
VGLAEGALGTSPVAKISPLVQAPCAGHRLHPVGVGGELVQGFCGCGVPDPRPLVAAGEQASASGDLWGSRSRPPTLSSSFMPLVRTR